MISIQPLHSNVVVEEFQLGEVTKGNILIPQVAKASTPYRYARVLAVGPGRYAVDGHLVPVSVKVGDVVAFARGQGYEFPLEDDDGNEKTLRMVNEQHIMGVMLGLPERSLITGLDGRLLQMQPGSRARSDGAYQQLDMIARGRKEGIIDSSGGTLDAMAEMDAADMEGD